MSLEADAHPALCPRCNAPMEQMKVRTAIWRKDRLAVIEDIPALICSVCTDQYYDDDVSDALRQLNETGFPEETADRIIQVPVFSLEGRLRKRVPLPEDTYVD